VVHFVAFLHTISELLHSFPSLKDLFAGAARHRQRGAHWLMTDQLLLRNHDMAVAAGVATELIVSVVATAGANS